MDLPGDVVFPEDASLFGQLTNCYWARQECEATPQCVVRPQIAQRLSTAVNVLQQVYGKRELLGRSDMGAGLFAVRGGGHSPVSGAATIQGGVLIVLSLLRDVRPSSDESYASIGAGDKWGDVSRVLDEKGLAVVGGRNSDVGVSGLTLGGGISFFSPQYGLVCSDIISYEIVLASGKITTASAFENPDLWRALKGGGNNFGIVTSFKARAFQAVRVWSGFLYMPTWQATKTLDAFYAHVVGSDATYDRMPQDR